ncbi:MAG: lipopolysaccharide biosynthesis protein RfbH [Candidatus Sericytochromatia bacterium]|nr:MAG: lipopolysaccharide biosynthesis protein RfbH [Candidatus Sericytochromatia bacterium]GIX42970.1 MAG: lipopolysaccharide biosynthesis protein RfbH [Leptospiraceae bacterium]
MLKQTELKQEILSKVKDYYKLVHEPKQKEKFVEGKSRINYAGRAFDENEMCNLVESALDFWLTYGRFSKEFEIKLANFLGVKYVLAVNSGSSANLLAFFSLTSPLLKERRIKRGDEVITVAAGFPTTIAPIIQYGAVPVFVDIDLETLNIDENEIEKAISDKTKAIMVAHTLGNPFNIEKVKAICEKYNLWLIEDNCDALGSKYKGKYTGTWGDIGTSSFYPPHHITMGEGGAVYTNNRILKKILLSMRDWGRDCWCESGVDNTCGARFSQKIGKLPFGYDHKYVYSHFGFNLKITDMQAAIGVAQLEKLPEFIKKRQENWEKLYNGLKDIEEFIFVKPQENSEVSWFGFFITLKDGIRFSRNEIVRYLEDKGIQTRNLFAGNITKHPAFDTLKEGLDYKVIGSLKNTDKIMNDGFWIGVYPGLSDEAISYIVKTINEFVERYV